MNPPKTTEMSFGQARVRIYPTRGELGRASAEEAADTIRRAVERSGEARIIVATGNSQLDMIEALAAISAVPWDKVDVFHMDEYVGLPKSHPASFRLWIRSRVEEKVRPRSVNYIEGDATDIESEIRRYAALLAAGPIDLAFVGFGENGHIAFNDPHEADFQDPAMLKIVQLDDACRRQQAGEGHFATPEDVPRRAVTITCPGLFRADRWICCVPEARKAEAVHKALTGPITTACPASIVRTHPNATVYLDGESAELLTA
jgi:glucosamine-6-phosphate deaminase